LSQSFKVNNYYITGVSNCETVVVWRYDPLGRGMLMHSTLHSPNPSKNGFNK